MKLILKEHLQKINWLEHSILLRSALGQTYDEKLHALASIEKIATIDVEKSNMRSFLQLEPSIPDDVEINTIMAGHNPIETLDTFPITKKPIATVYLDKTELSTLVREDKQRIKCKDFYVYDNKIPLSLIGIEDVFDARYIERIALVGSAYGTHKIENETIVSEGGIGLLFYKQNKNDVVYTVYKSTSDIIVTALRCIKNNQPFYSWKNYKQGVAFSIINDFSGPSDIYDCQNRLVELGLDQWAEL